RCAVRGHTGIQQQGQAERLVIAYQDDCLRDLIAASSIFGLGFASREEAMSNFKGLASDAAPSKQGPRVKAMLRAIHENGEFAGGHGSVRHGRIPTTFVQSALAG